MRWSCRSLKRRQSGEDANRAAAWVVRQMVASHSEPLPADLEAAWKQWSASIQGVDERGIILLRAAFGAGAQAASQKR
jgi:hypothetical protein